MAAVKDPIFIDENPTVPMISDPSPGYVGGENVILQQWNSSATIVSEKSQELKDYADQLQALVEEYTVDPGWTDELYDVTISPVTQIEEDVIPPPGTVTLPGFEAVVFPPAPTFPEMATIDTTITEPTEPAEVEAGVDYVVPAYTSAQWTALFNKINDDLENGGTGINSAVQTANHALNLERQRLANEKLTATGTTEIASRCLSFPQYAVRVMEVLAGKEILRQEYNSSNELEVTNAKLQQDHEHFIIDKAISLEQILRDFFKVVESLTLDAKKAIADFVLRNYAEKNKAYMAKWEALISSIRAKVEAAEMTVKQYNAIAAAYESATKGSIAQTEAISKERSSLVEAGKLDGDIFKIRVDAKNNYYGASTERLKAMLQASGMEIDRAKAALMALIERSGQVTNVQKEIIIALGTMSSQVMSAALNVTNTSVGHSTSRSSSVGETWSHGQTVYEGHNYSHKGDPQTPE